jgi:hypothetical protein
LHWRKAQTPPAFSNYALAARKACGFLKAIFSPQTL